MSKIDNNSKIAVFDSGMGGLKVLSDLKKLMPDEKFIYFADIKNYPYGNKTKDEVIEFSKKIVDFLIKKEVKAIVIGCNTASVCAYEELNQKYDINLYPITQIASNYLSGGNYQKLGVFATELTAKSKAYSSLINQTNPDIDVLEVSCKNWADFVESECLDKDELGIEIEPEIIKMKEFSPDKIVLGCTHYPFLTNLLEKKYKEAEFIDPSIVLASHVKKDLTNLELISDELMKNEPEDIYLNVEDKKIKIKEKYLDKIENKNAEIYKISI